MGFPCQLNCDHPQDIKDIKASWLVVSPLKNMKVSWGYYSQYMEEKKMFQTTNQKFLAGEHR